MVSGDHMTFDELTSIYRVESKSGSISEVRRDLYVAMATLTEDIRKEYELQLSKDPGSIICEGVSERRKKIILYSHKIVDQRMDKIARLALSGAMGADNPIDHLTDEEKDYYHSLLECSKKHRSLIERKAPPKAMMLNLETGKENIVKPVAKEDVVEPVAEEKIATPVVKEPDVIIPMEDVTEIEDILEETALVENTVEEDIMEEESVMIRVLEDLPVFSGPDRDYDLKKEDVISMPAVMANALISREKAVRLDITL